MKNVNSSMKIIFLQYGIGVMNEKCIRCLSGDRYAIIICSRKAAMKASMSYYNFGEHFLKGMMFELNLERQVRVKEMTSGGIRGKSSRQRKWHK